MNSRDNFIITTESLLQNGITVRADAGVMGYRGRMSPYQRLKFKLPEGMGEAEGGSEGSGKGGSGKGSGKGSSKGSGKGEGGNTVDEAEENEAEVPIGELGPDDELEL